MALKSPSVSFIVPTNRHEVDWLIQDIFTLIPKAKIIVVDDGKCIKKPKNRNITIIRHKTNLGLAQSLLDGYQMSLTFQSEYIVRVDADKEYPISPIPGLIEKLNANTKYSCAYVETKRSLKTNGLIDGLFHIIFGFIEGLVLFNQPMHQHSPGLHIYKADVVKDFTPKLKYFIDKYQLKWGLDLITLALAQNTGKALRYTAENPKWKERRPLPKIISQAKHAINIMRALKSYDRNSESSIVPEPDFLRNQTQVY